MGVTAPNARVITPQVARIHFDSNLNLWRVKASRQEDSTAGHFDTQDIETLLTFAQVVAWLINFFATTSPTGAGGISAPMGDLHTTLQALALETATGWT